jgi:hypothetical protein
LTVWLVICSWSASAQGNRATLRLNQFNGQLIDCEANQAIDLDDLSWMKMFQ